MNVISDAGSIGSWVVSAKNFEGIRSTNSSRKCEWDEMSFGVMIFAYAAIRAGTSSIKIAKRCTRPFVGGAKIFNHPFYHQLGFTIRVDGFLRGFFNNRNYGGVAIGCACA